MSACFPQQKKRTIGLNYDKIIGGKEGKRTGGRENRMTGQKVVRRTNGQKDRTRGTIHWPTHISIDVDVLHPAIIVLQLIYSAVNVQIAPRLNYIEFLA